jgi:hypothetical protein
VARALDAVVVDVVVVIDFAGVVGCEGAGFLPLPDTPDFFLLFDISKKLLTNQNKNCALKVLFLT